MIKEKLTAYEILEERKIEDLDSYSYLLKHKKTGAKVAVLENDDQNKVFYIGFRTPPKDSTGVAHIVEHTVLCGSELFPLKDPFVELVKGSLNTFLNAMTYPDKTVYPVASCNNKDFQNLMHVYLDAVFHPNIYHEKKIFMQEGWHYELENADDELKINGVVYNEMKGAFSSPDDVLSRMIFNSLYPDTAYGVESGGDPENIPDLTYEEFLDFHSKYYHPSNSYIYLYGDGDMAERLAFIDKEYLSKYEAINVDSFPGKQKAFADMKRIEKEYPISEEESISNNSFLSFNAVVETSLDQELYLAFQALDYALVEAEGAPVKQALIDANIGTEIYSTYDNGVYQPYFSIVAKNANPEQAQEFLDIIYSSLKKIVAEGIDSNALLAALNPMEFKYRESDFGSYPRGLMLGLQALDSWLYDENKPFMHIECNKTFSVLKKKIGTGYYESLIQKYLLDNKHKTLVVVKPQKGLNAITEKALADKLAKYKAQLKSDEIQKIIDETKELRVYQETPDSEDVLKTLPRLSREDLSEKVQEFYNDEKYIYIKNENNEFTIPVLHHNLFTNGIAYITLMFDITGIPVTYYPYLSLLRNFLGVLDTENHSYEQLGYETNIRTGGLYFSSVNFQHNYSLDDYSTYIIGKTKVFENNIEDAFCLFKEIIFATKFDNEKRIKELISEMKSRLQARFMNSGHTLAIRRALSYNSNYDAMVEQVSGIPFYRFLEDVEANFNDRKDEIVSKLKELMKFIFTKNKFRIDVAGREDICKAVMDEAEKFAILLSDNEFELAAEKDIDVLKLSDEVNEGIMLASQVQYVCRAGNFKSKGLEYRGALRVLKTIMGYEYLWLNVRVKGGAYGCMSGYSRNGNCYFVSYRDPNLKETIDVYEKAAEFIRDFNADEDEMTKYIIGTLSEMDIPLTPSMKAERSTEAYFSGISKEKLMEERMDVLNASADDIRTLAKYIEAFMEDNCLCVVGGEEKIKSEKDLFGKLVTLFH